MRFRRVVGIFIPLVPSLNGKSNPPSIVALRKDQILSIFRETEALLEGHFELTSGLHSPQYFQCARVLQHPRYLTELSGEIAEHFGGSGIQVVISPAIGGVVVGTEVGRQLGLRTIFTERKGGKMRLRRGFGLQSNERILVVEDVVTTGGSVFEVIDLVKEAKGQLAGVGCIVDRSDGKVNFDTNQFSVLQMNVVTYEPSECLLCQKKVPLIKPGSKGNY